ncbi:dolichol kinase [Recurvomyces mirabilis]|uniref:dolichol kinase n=1 Tax=Recurvomyces mirabilis TaxID=574656 RepID=A0AAE1C472_9PEZI|nr:dolichol kinase [Recurvomyces mirabilis]KAK5157344.1 dolichol kinase [Recurvomyces mirabilis]
MSHVKSPAESQQSQLQPTSITSEAEAVRPRTPRPYHKDGLKVRQDCGDRDDGGGIGGGDVVDQQGRHFWEEYDDHDGRQELQQPAQSKGQQQQQQQQRGQGRSGQGSLVPSESGTEADDERPAFVKLLPSSTLRPRKGLKTGEKSDDVLLTPSQLDDEGRRLPGEGYFKAKDTSEQGKGLSRQETREEEEKLMQVRFGEFVRRTSEVALMGVILGTVLCGHGVMETAMQWKRELLSHVVIIVVLIVAYPIKLSIVDNQAQHITTKLWQRFRVPASFDPATVLYPPLLPVLVALLVSPANEAVVLPNIILGLASLPQRLFPRSSRLGGFNAVHWLVSIVPLVLSQHSALLSFSRSPLKPYMLKSGPPSGLTPETLVSLYPLHHALLVPLHYLTTTSLLISELHLCSVALINLLLLATSPQMMILKACLWIGGVALFVLCGPVLHWSVTLARVPRWKLRRSGHTAEERKSLIDAVSELINLQRATAAFRGTEAVDSDADEDEPTVSIKEKIHGVPKLFTKLRRTSFGSPLFAPQSAVEPRQIEVNGFAVDGAAAHPRARRNTLPEHSLVSPQLQQRAPSSRRRPKAKLLWCLQLTPRQAERWKWLYAAYIYCAILLIGIGGVRVYVQRKALHGAEPFGWALSYLIGQLPFVRDIIHLMDLQAWVPLPPPASLTWNNSYLTIPLDANLLRTILGPANTRLALFAYWAAVIACGLLAVFTLTAFVEVDTRRKVFHGVMVAVLLPTVFIDPCYCALGLALVLAVFLLLEAIRAGQVPPLGVAIGRFVAPYVDGRDLRGPVVISHIFLLIGCAVPLWFSLASIQREGDYPWIDWELQSNKREGAMIAGVICVGMGDAAASLIGRRYGRHKWIWVGGKSLEGSAAFVVAVTIGLLAGKVWQVLGGWNDTVKPLHAHTGSLGSAACVLAWMVSALKAGFCACGASFMEAVLTGANDNVVVPVALWLLVKGSRF